jgi:ATP-binding cassette, subfamily B, bacterial
MQTEHWKVYQKKNWINFIYGNIFTVLSACVRLAIAFLLQNLVDLAVDGNYQKLKFLIGATILILVCDVVFWWFKRLFVHKYYLRALSNYKNHMFEKLLQRETNVFNKTATSNVISGFSNDVTVIEQDYFENIFNCVLYFTLLIGGLLSMAYLNVTLFISTIVLCLLPLLVSFFSGGKLKKQQTIVSNLNSDYINLLKDLLVGFPIIKSFQAEREMNDIFVKTNYNLENAKKVKRDIISKIEILADITQMIVSIIIFSIGAILAIKGEITAGVIMAFVQLLSYLTGPIEKLPVIINKIKASNNLVDKLNQCINTELRDAGTEILNQFKSSIDFSNVSFGYSEDKEVLSDINLSFKKGKSYAIVGISGSGKSTLINLLLGYFYNYKGTITIDDKELRSISSSSLYNLVSVIHQNVFLFNDDILSNVTLHKNFSKEEIQNALFKAGLDQLITEKGIDYKCGENGCNLSGGERQRISIARTLLKGTEVLLMDEATSALDSMTSKFVEEEILKLQDMTRIVVTHKLDAMSLKQYDEIIVLKDGHVIEQGRFDDLFQMKQYFYSLLNISGTSDL